MGLMRHTARPLQGQEQSSICSERRDPSRAVKGVETIREALRAATATAHAGLDEGMAQVDLGDAGEYADFLRFQLSARTPIEEWMAGNCAADHHIPSQLALIEADLAALGRDAAISPGRFHAPATGCLGVAWALGGSSLGNRAMLAGLRKRGADVPVAFLADPAMPAFFARLKRQLDRPAAEYAELPAAIAAAHAVFAFFVAARDGSELKRAA